MSNRDSFPCQATTFKWRIELFWIVYYQQWAAIFFVVFVLSGHVKDADFVHKRKKNNLFFPWFIKLWDVTYYAMCMVLRCDGKSCVMGNSSRKDPSKLLQFLLCDVGLFCVFRH